MKSFALSVLFILACTFCKAQVVANFLANNVCIGDTTQFLDASLPTPDSWQWNFGDTINASTDTSTLQNPIHVYTSPGAYIVSLIVTDSIYSDTMTKTVDVYGLPPASAGPDTFFCLGDNVTLHASGAGQNGTYTWSPNSYITCVNCQDPTVYPNTDLTYFVTVTDSNGCVAGDSVFVDRKKIPEALFDPFTFWKYAEFDNHTVDGETYGWEFGDGDTSTEFQPTHLYADFGTYHVVLYAFSVCGFDEYAKDITLENPASGVESINGIQMLVAPNPTDGKFAIILAEQQPVQSVVIYNNLGQIVYQAPATTTDRLDFDLSNFPKGIYHLVLQIDNTFASQNIIVR